MAEFFRDRRDAGHLLGERLLGDVNQEQEGAIASIREQTRTLTQLVIRLARGNPPRTYAEKLREKGIEIIPGKIRRLIGNEQDKRMLSGLELEDGRTAPAKVEAVRAAHTEHEHGLMLGLQFRDFLLCLERGRILDIR